MTTRAYLYRRNGTYYFRWNIPLACRTRMPANTPSELRISLRTTHPAKARHWSARCWLAAIETVDAFLVTRSTIRYHELVNAIKGRARMVNNTEATGPSQVSLGEVAGTVKLSAIKDVLAKLNRLGARFYVSIPRNSIALWVEHELPDGSLEPEL